MGDTETQTVYGDYGWETALGDTYTRDLKCIDVYLSPKTQGSKCMCGISLVFTVYHKNFPYNLKILG